MNSISKPSLMRKSCSLFHQDNPVSFTDPTGESGQYAYWLRISLALVCPPYLGLELGLLVWDLYDAQEVGQSHSDSANYVNPVTGENPMDRAWNIANDGSQNGWTNLGDLGGLDPDPNDGPE